jgi:pyruvate kinase
MNSAIIVIVALGSALYNGQKHCGRIIMPIEIEPPKRPPSRTKIVATLGPASDAPQQIEALIRAGVDVFRLNSAHGSIDVMQTRLDAVRRTARAVGVPVAVLVDLAGPKIRLGELPGGSVTCKNGETLTFVRGPEMRTAPSTTTLTPGPSPMTGEGRVAFPTLTATYPSLIDELEPNDRVMLADGTVELRVEWKDADTAVCRVVQGGTFRSRQGINLPGVKLRVRALTDNDKQYARWAAGQHVDYLGLSFVRRPEDIDELRQFIEAEKGDGTLLPERPKGCFAQKGPVPFFCPQIVAKIEKPEAVENLEAIIAATDAVMVARGDLGVEIDIAEVPLVQKRIIAACRRAGKPVIVATQMLESMHHSRLPTRAEATDVANAILDGADACMLSGETAVGEYPVESVQMMHRIALATETLIRESKCDADSRRLTTAGDDSPYFAAAVSRRLDDNHNNPSTANLLTRAVTAGAVQIAEQLSAKALVVVTADGETARIISRHRSFVHTVGISDSETTLRQMALFWGIIPMQDAPAQDRRQLIEHVIDLGRREGYLAAGDRVVLVLGADIAAAPQHGVEVYEIP